MAGDEYDEMTCRELVELVTDYLEERLPECDRVRFEVHVAECSHCAEYVAQMRRTIEVLGELSADAIDQALELELLAAFRGWRDA